MHWEFQVVARKGRGNKRTRNGWERRKKGKRRARTRGKDSGLTSWNFPTFSNSFALSLTSTATLDLFTRLWSVFLWEMQDFLLDSKIESFITLMTLGNLFSMDIFLAPEKAFLGYLFYFYFYYFYLKYLRYCYNLLLTLC